tara:strand:- start:883 stop:1119 length:237 start_codon:yes stop_codon:yes gene_type:complete
MSNLTYTIVPTAEIDNIDFIGLVENKSTVRYKIDGTEFIVKFNGSVPSDLTSYTQYTRDEILLYVNDDSNGWVNNVTP